MAVCVEMHRAYLLFENDKAYNSYGLLSVYKSERLHPGERYIVFISPDGMKLKTSCGEITIEDNIFTITTIQNNSYSLRLLRDNDEPFCRLWHICEVCGKRELLTPKEAFNKGWDYPPLMGDFGVISPRTCGSCSIKDTLWMRLVNNQSETTERDREIIKRIQNEPWSVLPDEGK